MTYTGRPPGQLLSTDAAWATHWPLPRQPRAEYGEREIWLWDFAGQPDYRLAHPLYMNETALAVFVFDPQDRNPLAGLAEWDRMMTRAAKKPFAKLHITGRCDRGGAMISRGLIDQFRQDHQFGPYFETIAQTGLGCDDPREAIIGHFDWDAIPYTVSLDTFRKLKEVIDRIKDRTYASPNREEKPTPAPVLVSSEALARMVSEEWKKEPKFTEDEFQAVISLLHGPGVIWNLEFGDQATIDRARENKQEHVFCGWCGKKIVLEDVIEQRFGAEETARQARAIQEQAQAALDNESKELILVGYTYVITGEAGQIYRQYTNSDHGIDGEIEFKNSKGDATSTLFYLQLKSGDSNLTTRKDGKEIFTIKSQRHVEYWRVRKYPVMLVIRASDGRI